MVRMAHPADMAIPECHDFATHQSFPGLVILSGYQKKDPGSDALAGLDICLVPIPSALACAELAGFDPIARIYSAIAATLAYFPGRLNQQVLKDKRYCK